MIINQSLNRVQYRTLITVLFQASWVIFALLIFLLRDWVLLCSPGWPGAHGNPPHSEIPAVRPYTPRVAFLCLLYICENQLCIYV